MKPFKSKILSEHGSMKQVLKNEKQTISSRDVRMKNVASL